MKLYRSHILVCHGTNCSTKAPQAIVRAFARALAECRLEDEAKVVETGCFGLCEQGPTVVVFPDGTLYTRVKPEDASEIVTEHILKGRVVERLVYRALEQPKAVQTYAESPYFARQVRVVLRNCGVIDPESMDEYIARGGYRALGKAVTSMTPAEVIEEIGNSKLRGRGALRVSHVIAAGAFGRRQALRQRQAQKLSHAEPRIKVVTAAGAQLWPLRKRSVDVRAGGLRSGRRRRTGMDHDTSDLHPCPDVPRHLLDLLFRIGVVR